jgi:hypothetical protein
VANPPLNAGGQSVVAAAVPTDGSGLKATLVHPWGGCSPASGWATLAATWSSYGTVPLTIDATSFCGTTPITYQALVANGAHTIVLSDPAGGNYQFTSDEIAALNQYAAAGHNVVGTYLTFEWSGGSIDNSGLGSLFGVTNTSWTGGNQGVVPTYTLNPSYGRLFRSIASPYVSAGYAYAQTPTTGTWTAGDVLNGPVAYQGINSAGSAVITSFWTCTYRTAYIANMPEYGGNSSDQQLLYNALTLPPPPTCS